MVWFQCEDCGDNLKKPKLPSHFNICSAFKLSCIDCGEIFGQQSVLGHTQCITETEKYGPKGQAKPLNGTTPQTNKGSKQQPDFDINVGLSDCPPWFCSLCNTKATSKQTLLLHAEGKKHKGKARAIHAANQQQKQTEESGQDKKSESEIPSNDKLVDEKCDGNKVVDPAKIESETSGSKASNGNLESKKKRKVDECEDDSMRKKPKEGTLVGIDNGEVIQDEKAERREKESWLNQDKALKSHSVSGESKGKIKWKKLITSALKSSPEGVMKMKKLRKHVLKALQESGITGNEDQLRNTLESKISSSSRFNVENKYVRLVAKN